MGTIATKSEGFASRDNRQIVYLKGTRFEPVCPYCGKRVRFVRTVKGKMMPCELDEQQGDGKMTLVTQSGVTVRKAGAEVSGYEPHWGFCRFGREDKSKCKEG